MPYKPRWRLKSVSLGTKLHRAHDYSRAHQVSEDSHVQSKKYGDGSEIIAINYLLKSSCCTQLWNSDYVYRRFFNGAVTYLWGHFFLVNIRVWVALHGLSIDIYGCVPLDFRQQTWGQKKFYQNIQKCRQLTGHMWSNCLR